MVFFTSILIVVILYFLQADGLVYAIMLALGGELINIIVAQTIAKSVEKKLKTKHHRSIQGYIERIKKYTRRIKELEKDQYDHANLLAKANNRIKELETQLGAGPGEQAAAPPPPKENHEPPPKKDPVVPEPPPPKHHENHLPAGSNRKRTSK